MCSFYKVLSCTWMWKSNGILEYFSISFLPLLTMLIISALTQVSDNLTLFMGGEGVEIMQNEDLCWTRSISQFPMSKIVCKKRQIGNVALRTFLFCYRNVNPQMKAWNKSNKKNIFIAPLSCKNKNKLNKVDIVSFNGKL